MNLYAALYSGVSGLAAQSTAMAGVADNITNINTVGYKGVSTQFQTLVTQGATRAANNWGGVDAVPRQLISRQGLLQASSSQTDLGIDGAGFFVTRSSPDPAAPVSFTRAGSFQPDNEGYLRNAGGYYLQGWRLDANGTYADTGNLAELEPVRLANLTGTATPTSSISLRLNLKATQEVAAGAYTAGDMASGAVTPHFSRQLTVHDAQGNAHQLQVSYLKTGTNSWASEIHAVPASDVSAAGGLLASGTIAFNPDGSLDKAGSDAALFGPLTPAWTNGAAAQPIALQLGDDGALNGLTQFGSESGLLSSSINGGLLGSLAAIEVTEAGIVKAIFADGTSRAVFQLPVATFPNPDGLTRLPGNGYRLSEASGAVAIGRPGVLGAGRLQPGTLEAANVDLGEEFSAMIRFQRAYSSASKIITTVDEMLQEVSNLKR
ncbi:MAG: hypothetical protein RIS17_203 [Pseudomonadota bacterium]